METHVLEVKVAYTLKKFFRDPKQSSVELAWAWIAISTSPLGPD